MVLMERLRKILIPLFLLGVVASFLLFIADIFFWDGYSEGQNRLQNLVGFFTFLCGSVLVVTGVTFGPLNEDG
jgi:hypothetical protein